MRKKDYQAIARVFYDAGCETMRGPEDETWQILRRKVISLLAQDNPRFEPDRFITATETGACKGMKRREVA